MPTSFFNKPVTELMGIGRVSAEKLSNLSIDSIFDLLTHTPTEYQDKTKVIPISDLVSGQPALVIGRIIESSIKNTRKLSLTCVITDETDELRIHFFNSYAAQKDQLKTGLYLRCFGSPRQDFQGMTLYHPEYETASHPTALIPKPYLTSVYRGTTGLTQYQLRKFCDTALSALNSECANNLSLPIEFEKKFNLWNLKEALNYLHNPPANDVSIFQDDHPAKYRIVFEELLAYQINLQQLKKQYQSQKAPALLHFQLLDQFINHLPFQLTQAQIRVAQEIRQDLAQDTPMLRLLQGDVGSGKTIVAALAALQCIENGYQIVLLSPTELLAEQHYMNFKAWFETLPLQVGLLTGKLSASEKQACVSQIKNGKIHFIIGTHAVFQSAVLYHKLGCVIVDEQHRFGVEQRSLLLEKAKEGCHQLLMTATPIPRTLAMSLYAHLNISIIDELPSGRVPIKTSVMPSSCREDILLRIKKACLKGAQAYWVCPLIEENEQLEAQSAETTAHDLSVNLPDLKIGLLHGRLQASEKNRIMDCFARGDIDILVATTVIEVGIDVSNASIIIIENANRLGLAQLHQLRGRVGRGSQASYCILLYQLPVSQIGFEKLKVMKNCQDGFLIAEKDLLLRGSGEVNGVKQTGAMNFRVADLFRDQYLLPTVLEAAEALETKHPEYIDSLIARWKKVKNIDYSYV